MKTFIVLPCEDEQAIPLIGLADSLETLAGAHVMDALVIETDPVLSEIIARLLEASGVPYQQVGLPVAMETQDHAAARQEAATAPREWSVDPYHKPDEPAGEPYSLAEMRSWERATADDGASVLETLEADAVVFTAPTVATFPPAEIEQVVKRKAAAVGRKQCPVCGDFFDPRSNRQVTCDKVNCKKARAKAMLAARKGNGAVSTETPAEADAADGGFHLVDMTETPAAAQPGESKVIYQTPAVEAAQEPNAVAGAWAEVLGVSAETPVHIGVDLAASEVAAVSTETSEGNERVWYVEDGPRAGTRMTSSQLRRLLLASNMKRGQHVRHSITGQHQVERMNGGVGQKLVRLYGENAPQVVLPGEI